MESLLELLKSRKYDNELSLNVSTLKPGDSFPELIELLVLNLVTTEESMMRNVCAIALSDLRIAWAMPIIEKLAFDERNKTCCGSLFFALEEYGWILESSEKVIQQKWDDPISPSVMWSLEPLVIARFGGIEWDEE